MLTRQKEVYKNSAKTGSKDKKDLTVSNKKEITQKDLNATTNMEELNEKVKKETTYVYPDMSFYPGSPQYSS